MGRDHSKKVAGRIYVRELADSIDRTQHTIRQWQRNGSMPTYARPRRDERGWRYWSPEQVDLIREWMNTRRPQPPEKLTKMRAKRGGDAEAA